MKTNGPLSKSVICKVKQLFLLVLSAAADDQCLYQSLWRMVEPHIGAMFYMNALEKI